jgi:hypothetical protein
LPGTDRKDADLGAFEVILDEDGGARLAEASLETSIDPNPRLLKRVGDQDAFSSGETVGLDHKRAIHLMEIAMRLFRVGERV